MMRRRSTVNCSHSSMGFITTSFTFVSEHGSTSLEQGAAEGATTVNMTTSSYLTPCTVESRCSKRGYHSKEICTDGPAIDTLMSQFSTLPKHAKTLSSGRERHVAVVCTSVVTQSNKYRCSLRTRSTPKSFSMRAPHVAVHDEVLGVARRCRRKSRRPGGDRVRPGAGIAGRTRPRHPRARGPSSSEGRRVSSVSRR
jgi:hypothetical protein